MGVSKFNWKFFATDIDEVSLKIANENIEMNNYKEYITLFHVKDSNLLLDGVLPDDKIYDFCMCNPPFFADEEESIRTNPNTICTGTKNELETTGGEVEFTLRILKDSLKLKDKICWFTTMLGKKKSLKELKIEFIKQSIDKYYITEFIQGKVTRWGFAWTFQKIEESKSSIEIEPKMYIEVNNKNFIETFKILSKIFESFCTNIKKEEYICKLSGNLKNGTKTFVKMNMIQKNQFIIEVIGTVSIEFKEFYNTILSKI